MLTCTKYYSRKRRLLVVLSLVFSFAVQAQTDTTPVAPDEDSVIEEYRVEQVTNKSFYFLDKRLQANGGGPDSLQLRNVPDSVIKNLQANDDFWYVNYSFKEKKREKRNTPLAEQSFFQLLLWLLIIGGFIAFLTIYLSSSNVGLFRKGNKVITSGDEESVDMDNIFDINYQREIDKAVSGGNYRLAVRLLFLRSLKNLSDRKLIEYKQDRTNFDYLVQLHPTRYYNDFFRITRSYEYAWYGQFEIGPDKYAIIKSDFENFGNNVNSR